MGANTSRSIALKNEGKTDALVCEHYSAEMERSEISVQDLMYRLHWDKQPPSNRWQQFLSDCWGCCLCSYIFCCPPSPPCIIKKVAFQPPKPTYEFVEFGPKPCNDYRLKLSENAKDFLLISTPQFRAYYPLIGGFYVDDPVSKRKRKNGLACVYVSHPSIYNHPWTPARKILFISHSNAEDLGLMVSRILTMTKRVVVDVLAYDYSGYGRSGGNPSESKLYADAERVYDYLINVLKVPWTKIIALGTSLGTAASIHLASRRKVNALILQGSFSSALRTVCPQAETTGCMDRFPNALKIRDVNRPTLFVHGESDKLFSLDHVKFLRARCPGAANVEPLIIHGCDHVDFDRFDEYWTRLRQFVHEDLMTEHQQISPMKSQVNTLESKKIL